MSNPERLIAQAKSAEKKLEISFCKLGIEHDKNDTYYDMDDTSYNMDDTCTIIENISGAVSELTLSYNALGDVTKDNLRQIATRVPKSIIALSIVHNKLDKLPEDAFVEFLANLSESLNALNLSNNELAKLNSEQLQKIINSIPKKVDKLIFASNNLGAESEFVFSFAGMTAPVTFLDISGNSLGNLRGNALVDMFASFPKNLKTLDISGNELCKVPTAELTQAFVNLPSQVTEIHLRGNNLCNKTFSEVRDIFSSIPRSVTFINVSFNWLQNFSFIELWEIFGPLLQRGVEIVGIHHLPQVNLQYNSQFNIYIKAIRDGKVCNDVLAKLPDNLRENLQGIIAMRGAAEDEQPLTTANSPQLGRELANSGMKAQQNLNTTPNKNGVSNAEENELLAKHSVSSNSSNLSSDEEIGANTLSEQTDFVSNNEDNVQSPITIEENELPRDGTSPAESTAENECVTQTPKSNELIALLLKAIDEAKDIANITRDDDIKVLALKNFVIENSNKGAEMTPNNFKSFASRVVNKSKEILGAEHIFVRTLRDILNVLSFILIIGAYNMLQNKKENGSYFKLFSNKQKIYNNFDDSAAKLCHNN